MNDSQEHSASPVSQRAFPATVVEVQDPYTVAINRGSSNGIKVGQRFLIYGLSDKEIVDPETQESLGYLEIVRGTGTVVHLQEKLATIETDKTRKKNRVIAHKPRQRYPALFWPDADIEKVETIEGDEIHIAFDDAKIGDKARPI